jgi:hypothetical protein
MPRGRLFRSGDICPARSEIEKIVKSAPARRRCRRFLPVREKM